MSKIKGTIAIVILALSWIALFWLTGSRTPWNSYLVEKNDSSISLHLGDIPTENYDRMGFTKAVVHYVAAEKAWLVGTEKGELFLVSNEGKQLWKRSLGIGKFIAVCISQDSKLAFVGEQSQDGNIYCFDTHTGDILWKQGAKPFVGAEPEKRSYPSTVHIVADKDNNIYANFYRFVVTKEGKRAYLGRLVSFSPTGKMRWQYPKQEMMDSWINWCDVSDASGRAVLSTSAYEFREEMKYKDTMYIVDKNNGELLDSMRLNAVPPFDNAVMRGSPNFSKNGEYLAASPSDGRGILFDKTGKIIWSRGLSRPTEVDGSIINASGREGYITDYGVLFTTIATFNRENWQLPTPVEHPSSNSLFAFNLDGSFKFQYKAKATMEMVAFSDNGLAACAIGRNVRTHDYKAHGALVVDLQDGKEKHFFHTDGPVQAIDITPDGTMMAGVEAPAVTPEGKIIGAYKLHIWKL